MLTPEGTSDGLASCRSNSEDWLFETRSQRDARRLRFRGRTADLEAAGKGGEDGEWHCSVSDTKLLRIGGSDMLRRRVLTPEEVEHQKVGSAPEAVAKPNLLSRLRMRRNAGESRTTVAPAETRFSTSPAPLPPPRHAESVQERRSPPASTMPGSPTAAEPSRPMSRPAPEKARRPIRTGEEVRRRYTQESAADE